MVLCGMDRTDQLNMILTFDVYKAWPRVQHLFEKTPGKWADGVSVNSQWPSSFVEVECPQEYAAMVEPLFTYIDYHRRKAD